MDGMSGTIAQSASGGGTTLVTKTLATQFDKTNSDTPAIVTGLTTGTLAIGTWRVTVLLRITANATGGGDVSLSPTGTVSVGVYDVVFTNTATGSPFKGTRVVSTALGETTWNTTTSVLVTIEATLTFTVAGTVRILFCQETATPATTSSVLVGSSITAIPLS